jgi:hypothetical protein
MHCSHRRRGEIVPYYEVLPDETGLLKQHKCDVETCSRNAYEKHKISIGDRDWIVCSFHKDRMYNFTHRKMEASRIPFIVNNGKLYDNPRYLNYSQCGKRGGQ